MWKDGNKRKAALCVYVLSLALLLRFSSANPVEGHEGQDHPAQPAEPGHIGGDLVPHPSGTTAPPAPLPPHRIEHDGSPDADTQPHPDSFPHASHDESPPVQDTPHDGGHHPAPADDGGLEGGQGGSESSDGDGEGNVVEDGHEDEDEHASKHEKGTDKDHGHAWTYAGMYGPGNWSVLVPLCHSDNSRQSPIDIVIKDTRLSELLDRITLSDARHPGGNFSDSAIVAVNNGHTVGFKFNHVIEVFGGDLNSFRVAGAHFHWGATDETGSEHLLDGRHFPLELHIVTYDEKNYDGLAQAIDGYNSLAVLGIQYIISEEDNPALVPLIDAVQKVQQLGVRTNVDEFDLSTLLPEHTEQYYRYEGSLTTPPCSQSVVWTVFKHPSTISSAQLAHFRQLLEGPPAEDGSPDYISHNWRPVQPLQTREVLRSFTLPSDHVKEVVKKEPNTNPKAKEVKGTKPGGASESVKYSLFLLTTALLVQFS